VQASSCYDPDPSISIVLLDLTQEQLESHYYRKLFELGLSIRDDIVWTCSGVTFDTDLLIKYGSL
jgi:hypothetical protein